jgi:hypothetical protein
MKQYTLPELIARAESDVVEARKAFSAAYRAYLESTSSATADALGAADDAHDTATAAARWLRALAAREGGA